MSGHIVIPFRTLKKTQRENLGILYTSCEATFLSNTGEVEELPLDSGGSSMENSYIIGDTQHWNPDLCDCNIKQELLLNPVILSSLFDCKNGIVDKKAVLGISALWSISKSNISGCETLPVELSFEELSGMGDDQLNVPLNLDFAAGMLAGKLTVRYQLFLKKATTGRHGKGTANVVGTLLGELTDPLEIEIDGDGSLFPIVTVERPDMPLWWIDSENLEDPLTDPMDQEFFSFVINTKHRDYTKLYAKKGLVIDTPLYREVFSAGLEEMFRRLYLNKDDIADKMKMADQGDEGSIALCFDYMRKSLEIDVDTPERLHISIRQAVEKQLKGAAS